MNEDEETKKSYKLSLIFYVNYTDYMQITIQYIHLELPIRFRVFVIQNFRDTLTVSILSFSSNLSMKMKCHLNQIFV